MFRRVPVKVIHVSYVRYQQYLKCDSKKTCFISKTAFKSWFYLRAFRKLPDFGIYRKKVIKWMLLYIFATNNEYLHFQCIRLYHKLNIELSVNHIHQVCCTRSLTDKEIFMLNYTFSVRSSLSETEHVLKLYIIWYIWLRCFQRKYLRLR